MIDLFCEFNNFSIISGLYFPLMNLKFLNLLLMKFHIKNTIENLHVHVNLLFYVGWRYDHKFTSLSYWSKGSNSLQFLHKHFSHWYPLHSLGNGLFSVFMSTCWILINVSSCVIAILHTLLDVFFLIFMIFITTK